MNPRPQDAEMPIVRERPVSSDDTMTAEDYQGLRVMLRELKYVIRGKRVVWRVDVRMGTWCNEGSNAGMRRSSRLEITF